MSGRWPSLRWGGWEVLDPVQPDNLGPCSGLPSRLHAIRSVEEREREVRVRPIYNLNVDGEGPQGKGTRDNIRYTLAPTRMPGTAAGTNAFV